MYWIVIHLPFIANSSIIVISYLNVLFGCMFYITSGLPYSQHFITYVLRSYKCVPFSVASCNIINVGIFVAALMVFRFNCTVSYFFFFEGHLCSVSE